MNVNMSKISNFINNFDTNIYPVIHGEDGTGIEKFRSIVEKKRKEVSIRKIKKLQIEIEREISKEINDNKYISFSSKMYERENSLFEEKYDQFFIDIKEEFDSSINSFNNNNEYASNEKGWSRLRAISV